jgi:hypothetical protein
MLVIHSAQDGDILELHFDLAHVDIVFSVIKWLKMI